MSGMPDRPTFECCVCGFWFLAKDWGLCSEPRAPFSRERVHACLDCTGGVTDEAFRRGGMPVPAKAESAELSVVSIGESSVKIVEIVDWDLVATPEGQLVPLRCCHGLLEHKSGCSLGIESGGQS